MDTVEALLGERPSAAEAADLDSIASIWVLIAKTIREAGNQIESQLVRGVAARTDVAATEAIAEARKVFPTTTVKGNNVNPQWKQKRK